MLAQLISMQTDDFKCLLWQADCRDVLPKLPLASVDGIIADPPFGIGFKYNSHDDDPTEYIEWLWPVLEQCERVCKPGSPLFVYQALPNIKQFAKWFPRDWRMIAAAKNFVQMRKGSVMQYSWDPVLVWWTPGKTYTKATKNRDFHLSNQASKVSDPSRPERKHPCPRPIDQVMHFVSQWIRPGGVVLDPFMGSGTTGVACHRLGMGFIGIEKDESYYKIASARIRKETSRILVSAKRWTVKEERVSS